MLSKTTGLRNFLIISSQSIVISFRNAAENDVQILEICDSSSFKCIPTLIRVSMRYGCALSTAFTRVKPSSE